MENNIGYTCAYTPLPLIHAAGFVPYRVFPVGDAPDRAGQLLHDNLCPHVKRVLDRAMSGDLPELHGMVFINSCDAMRRLADAWQSVRTEDPVILLDLPVTAGEAAAGFFAGELERLAGALANGSGRQVDETRIASSVELYNRMAGQLDTLGSRMRAGKMSGGSARLQQIYSQSATRPVEETITALNEVIAEPAETVTSGVPVYLFGNVLPDPEVFMLFESCGTRIADDDFCTGSRQFARLDPIDERDIFTSLARAVLERPACARTFSPEKPGSIAGDILQLRGTGCDRPHDEVLRPLPGPDAGHPGDYEKSGYAPAAARGRLHPAVHRTAAHPNRSIC